MNNHLKYFLSLLFSASLCLSDAGYNTIYLMEFENLKNDFTNANLKEALPDLIKEIGMENRDFRLPKMSKVYH